MELEGGANFSRSLRRIASLETLKGETTQMRRVREKEEQTFSHFESLASEIGTWSWKGASVRENSLHSKDSIMAKRITAESTMAQELEKLEKIQIQSLPPLLSSTHEPSFHFKRIEEKCENGKRTSGDDITSIRRAMQAISNKNASLFALTELIRSDSGSMSNAEGKRSRHLQLLRQGDALVEQAIHHMERSGQHRDGKLIISS